MKRGIVIGFAVLALIAVVVIVAMKRTGIANCRNGAGNQPPPVLVNRQAPSAPSNTPPATPSAVLSKAPIQPPEPPYVPPTVATPALSNVLDRSKDFVDRVHGLASGAVPEVKNQKDLATLAKQLSDPKEDRVVRNEIVNLLFRSNYPELEGVLRKILENPDEGQEFRAWAVQHIGDLLTNPGDIPVSPDLTGRVRTLLSDSDLHVRREALLALSRANDTQMLQELPAMLKSQAPGSDRLRDNCSFRVQSLRYTQSTARFNTRLF